MTNEEIIGYVDNGLYDYFGHELPKSVRRTIRQALQEPDYKAIADELIKYIEEMFNNPPNKITSRDVNDIYMVIDKFNAMKKEKSDE